MSIITSKDYAGKVRTLVHKDTRMAVKEGEEVKDFRGQVHIIRGGRAPQKPSSVGHIWTKAGAEYYASVVDLVWE